MDCIVQSIKFPPAGRCIYCGLTANQTTLSEEHIIPFGLNGYLKYPYASCSYCAKVTAKFEQTCQRSLFGPARIHMGLRTRNKKERPTELPVKVKNADGHFEQKLVQISDHPCIFGMMDFPPPNILSGVPLGTRHSKIRMKIANIQENTQARIDRLGILKLEQVFPIWEFKRMLAKIAHAYASALFGTGTFEALLPNFIVNRGENFSDFIGGADEYTKLEATKTITGDKMLHELQVALVWKGDPRTTRPMLVVYVQLFACFGMPIYQVVVGRGLLSGTSQLQRNSPKSPFGKSGMSVSADEDAAHGDVDHGG